MPTATVGQAFTDDDWGDFQSFGATPAAASNLESVAQAQAAVGGGAFLGAGTVAPVAVPAEPLGTASFDPLLASPAKPTTQDPLAGAGLGSLGGNQVQGGNNLISYGVVD